MNILFFDIIAIIILAITPTTTGNIYMIKSFMFILLIITNIFVISEYLPIPNLTISTSNTTTTPNSTQAVTTAAPVVTTTAPVVTTTAPVVTAADPVSQPVDCNSFWGDGYHNGYGSGYGSGYSDGVASTMPKVQIIQLSNNDLNMLVELIYNSKNSIIAIEDSVYTIFAIYGIDVSFSSTVAINNTTTPGATTPGATTPGATTPGATTPGATTPDATTPEATTPGVTAAKANKSGATTPGATTPGATTPGATTPGATTPGATTPGATTPGATTPGSTTAVPLSSYTTTPMSIFTTTPINNSQISDADRLQLVTLVSNSYGYSNAILNAVSTIFDNYNITVEFI